MLYINSGIEPSSNLWYTGIGIDLIRCRYTVL